MDDLYNSSPCLHLDPRKSHEWSSFPIASREPLSWLKVYIIFVVVPWVAMVLFFVASLSQGTTTLTNEHILFFAGTLGVPGILLWIGMGMLLPGKVVVIDRDCVTLYAQNGDRVGTRVEQWREPLDSFEAVYCYSYETEGMKAPTYNHAQVLLKHRDGPGNSVRLLSMGRPTAGDWVEIQNAAELLACLLGKNVVVRTPE